MAKDRVMTLIAETDTPREYTVEEVQFLVDNLYHTLEHWVGKFTRTSAPVKERMESFCCNFATALEGNAGGFDSQGSLYIYSTPEQIAEAKSSNRNFFPASRENAYRLEPAVLEYLFDPERDKIIPGPVSRQWTQEEAVALFRRELSYRLDVVVDDKEGTDFTKGHNFLKSMLEFFEDGFSDNLGKADIVIEANEEQQENFLEENKNFFAFSTVLNSGEKSLLATYVDVKNNTQNVRSNTTEDLIQSLSLEEFAEFSEYLKQQGILK